MPRVCLYACCVYVCVFGSACVCLAKWKWKSSQSPKTTAPEQINPRRSERQVIYLAIVRCFLLSSEWLLLCLLLGIAPEHPTHQDNPPTHRPPTRTPTYSPAGYLNVALWSSKGQWNNFKLLAREVKQKTKSTQTACTGAMEKAEIMPAVMALGIRTPLWLWQVFWNTLAVSKIFWTEY